MPAPAASDQRKRRGGGLLRMLADEANRIGRAAHNAAAAGAGGPSDSASVAREEQKMLDYNARSNPSGGGRRLPSTTPKPLPYRKGKARKEAAAKLSAKLGGK